MEICESAEMKLEDVELDMSTYGPRQPVGKECIPNAKWERCRLSRWNDLSESHGSRRSGSLDRNGEYLVIALTVYRTQKVDFHQIR